MISRLLALGGAIALVFRTSRALAGSIQHVAAADSSSTSRLQPPHEVHHFEEPSCDDEQPHINPPWEC